MEPNEILPKVQEVFRDVLDDDNIVLTSETTADDVEDWDSLNHIQLVVAVEKKLGIKFTSHEIQSWKNVGEMVECISKKGMILQLKDKFEKTFIISDKIYEGFILMFQDTNPLHTDEQFALKYGFKGRVMHGNILNGFLSYFIGECLPIKNVIIHTQNIQFKKPVYLQDKIFFEAIVNDVFESVNAVEFKFSFKNEVSDEVAKGKIQIGILT